VKNEVEAIPLQRLVDIKTGKLNSNAAKPNGEYPFFTCSQDTFLTDSWSFDGEYVLLAGNNAAGVYALKYFKGKFDAYQRTYAIRSINADKLCTRYLFYALRPQLEHMKNISTGAATKFLTLSILNDININVFSIQTQKKVVTILSAYDDLIENNQRRIKILEEMAQNLYREWFVKYRFPGHQEARFVDSPLGPIPEGWEVIRYLDLLASGLGGDWGSEEPDEEENNPVYVIRGTDFEDIANGAILRTPRRFITSASNAKRQLIAGDIIVENSVNAKSRCVGTPLLITNGVLQRLSEPAIAASFCKVYRFKNPSLAPLAHLHMRHIYREGKMAFYQNIAANGIGNFQSQRFLESEHLILPLDSQRQKEMLNFLKDLTNTTLIDQAYALRRTRDLLLPRLISGELDVSELDIAIPEEAE